MCKMHSDSIVVLVYFTISSCAFASTAPKLAPIVNNQVQVENSSFVFVCSVQQGSHPLFFEWFKNGDQIKASPNNNHKIENFKILSTLTIEKIIQSDSGNYTCLVKNAAGSDSRNVFLTVKGNLFQMFHY